MKIYIKETRDKNGTFYRRGDWGVEKFDGWDNKRVNWTTVKPPEECLDEIDPIPCDWNEENLTWDAPLIAQRKWEKELEETDVVMPRYVEDIWDVIGIDKAPTIVKERYQIKKAIRSKKPM